MVEIMAAGAGAVFACALVAAIVGIAKRDNGIADVAWGFLFVLGAVAGAAAAPRVTNVTRVVIVLVALWALRLSSHIGTRRVQHGAEDWRYAESRAKWPQRKVVLYSVVRVYLFQALLATIVSLPIFVIEADASIQITLMTYVGTALFAAGLAEETIGDMQLRGFLSRKRAGLETASLCTIGLWSRTRHPNYFGEALLWWGIAVIALGAEQWPVALIGPLTITVLVRYVSGVPLLEKTWSTRPGFTEWAERTPVFVPWPRFLRR